MKMKNIYFIIAAILALLMLTLPLICTAKSVETGVTMPLPEQTDAADTLTVLDFTTNETFEVTFKDYLFGVVAAEMPMTYEDEALKAQTVTAYTYTLYTISKNTNEEYDISTDSSTFQGYISREKAREKWGDKADQYEKRLDGIIADVQGIYICLNGSPIMAVYHAISGGKTEGCENVWGTSLPYLAPKESLGDLLATDYLSSVTVSPDNLKEAFKDKCEFSGEAKDYIGKITKTDSGYVKQIQVGNTALSGTEFRKALNLRSANFDVAYTGGNFTFSVRGYGHGVGLSQNGANYMAQQGNTYTEILNWYYTGCVLQRTES